MGKTKFLAATLCIPFFAVTITGLLSGCNGDSATSSVADAAASVQARTMVPYSRRWGQTGSSTAALTISGTPITTVVAGSPYSFTPSTVNAGGSALSFSIANQPSWATFYPATGQLAGTPDSSGSYAGITISVSNGRTTASLAPFTVTVTSTPSSSVTLSWVAPTLNTNGSALTNLTGYIIYYGNSASTLSQSVTIDSPGVLTYVMSNLTAGTWYFAVAAVTSSGVQSAYSAVGSTTIG